LSAVLLKYASGVSCAYELQAFGGPEPNAFGQLSLTRLWAMRGSHGCWPSGHASGGFALFALGMLDRPARLRRLLWRGGLAIGSGMGIYQVLRGAHFLSHILVTAFLAQLLACLLARVFQRPSV
jgi:membrane-associated PAP2 superfamily phosphatase